MAVRDFRDPLYEYIRLSGTAAQLVDTRAMQRMRRIKQLGYAYTVYPSATHTRFEHMIGAYHLSRQVLFQMRERGEVLPEDEAGAELVHLAALLHDTAHFPSAHLLEEYGLEEADHEKAAEAVLLEGEVAEILLKSEIPGAPEKVAEIIRHAGHNPLRTLVAGAVDVDRLDYMRRDAHYCGLPPSFEQQRLVNALTLAYHPGTGERTVMLYEKGINALDDMVWQRYSLYLKVYRHSTVRSASVMARALVIQALERRLATLREVQQWSDDEMFFVLAERIERAGLDHEPGGPLSLLQRLRDRSLYKRAAWAPLGSVPFVSPRRLRRVEARLADELGLSPWEALLDIPHKPGMFEPDIFIVRKDGSVVHRSALTPEDGYVSNERSEGLYRAAGTVSLFTARQRSMSTDRLLRTIETALAESEAEA